MVFPMKARPALSYHSGGRKFGALRDDGKRLHAGCDLIAPIGTPVYAVADGRITAFYHFYKSSWAIEVHHGGFVVRYGEVKPQLAAGLKVGDQVFAKQMLGEVGKLEGLNSSMLHFELYAGTHQGPLSVAANTPYRRRADLKDPTAELDAAAMPFG
jgi:murein DD-endopeptidase MepM/ murein hydrolase activator NlpD